MREPFDHRRILAALLTALLAAPASGCDPFPRDPMDTLANATGDTLRVGATEAPPWVIRQGDDAHGVEAEAVRQLADSIGAVVRWYWGPPEEHFAALERYELAAAIGGLTAGTPWRKHLGLTVPYYTSEITVGVPPGEAPPANERALDGRRVAVRAGSETVALLEEHGAVPVSVERTDTVTALWVAAPDWELRARGWTPAPFHLLRKRHVVAAPAGENRFLMALEDVFQRMDVDALVLRGVRP